MAKKTPVAEWLEAKYREWRAEQPSMKAGIGRFAEYLGISPDSLNTYLSRGSSPTGENLEKIAARLGPEIYDLLGLVRPVTIDALEDAPSAADSAERAEWAHLIDGVPDDVVEMWIASIRAMRERMRAQQAEKATPGKKTGK